MFGQLVVAVAAMVTGSSQAATPPYQIYDDKNAFMAAVQGAQVLTQDFSGYAAGASLSGSEILPGVTVTSSFANLVVWQDGSLFGYDDSCWKESGNRMCTPATPRA
jgi:Tfp pilus assembly major pilin PilA